MRSPRRISRKARTGHVAWLRYPRRARATTPKSPTPWRSRSLRSTGTTARGPFDSWRAQIEDRLREFSRCFQRWIVSDALEDAPFIARLEVLLVSDRHLRGMNAIFRAVNRDGRHVDRRQGRQSRLDGRIARIAVRRRVTVPVRVNRDVDEVRVVERPGRAKECRLVEGPCRRPQFPQEARDPDATGREPSPAALGAEVVLVPEAALLLGFERLSCLRNVLDLVAADAHEPAHSFRPQRRDDARRARTPIESGKQRLLDSQRVQQLDQILPDGALLPGSRRLRREEPSRPEA